MSFKCDGDNNNLLKNLADQRVRELLGSHIPQDEAKLLSNGRLTCTICLHRPVFDTINMLANHRRGKRHLSELCKYIKCKEAAERKMLQRKHGCSNTVLGDQPQPMTAEWSSLTALSSSLLGYKHVVAKQRVVKHLRKPILEIQQKKPLLTISKAQNDSGKSTSTRVKHYLKNMSRKTSLEQVVERNRDNYGIDLQKIAHSNSCPEERTDAIPESQLSTVENNCSLKSIKTQEYEMKLRMSGWIKDLTGKWIKDPNVEFDSDEEETPPPPPP